MAEIKEQLKTLMQQRDLIEQKVAVCSARLEAGGAGLHDPLTDREGFPRSDIDVHATRNDRHSIAVLSNDHKALTAQIDQLLQQLHAQNRPEASPSTHKKPRTDAQPVRSDPGAAQASGAAAAASAAATGSLNGARPASGTAASSRPYAVVDEVSPDSPASTAGIRLGDQLVSFGDVSWRDGQSELKAVAAELQASENQAVPAAFLRQGHLVTLSLTPQRWAGRGLLGCHLRPL
ncbi:hypothetical protein WJX72_010756 [[Myrmecia] bisecta]|uniref:26S proteasome non-ATPase regulatory subunit 9 n=1 Tax=[Myrmecia] bisecta TaxID=41462 RepID=A0AAW1R9P6_9CHLO